MTKPTQSPVKPANRPQNVPLLLFETTSYSIIDTFMLIYSKHHLNMYYVPALKSVFPEYFLSAVVLK